MLRQASFSDLEYANKKRRTRRELFLAEMEAVVPWQELLAVMEPRPAMDVPTAICRGSCLDYWAPPWHLSAHEIAAHIRPSLNATRIPATVVRRRVVRACHARQYRAAEPMRRCSARVKDPGHDRKISEPLRSRPRGVFHFWP